MNRILIVDDREDSRYFLNVLLRNNGYFVESACHGAEALDKALREPPLLAVSDLLMPVMDGYTLLRHWRADDRLKQIPFVVYTATYTDPKDEQLALSLGADAFILKPAEPADLLAHIQRVLARPTRGEASAPLPAGATTPARIPVVAPDQDETRNLRQYSEALIRKLEDKMEQLEAANRRLQNDLAERKHIEAQLRQSQKMEAVGQLASGVAHDFNNLLTIMHGNAALQLSPDLSPAERVECARQIIMAAERAAGLTRQLLLFGRKQVMQPATLDLNEVVGGMIKMLKRILGEDVALHSELAPALPPLFADVGMIEQVLLNLAVNSRDAMPDGGRLTITTGAQTLDEAQALRHPEAHVGQFVYLDVSDTGSGIDPEVLPRIFEPFFTTKEVGKGTGLGLATVHGIVEQHHGWITVSSRAGEGTAFRIHLPAMEARQAASAPAPAPVRMPAGNETILVVEDEPALRLLAGNVLQRCGYTVLRSETAVAALALWMESKPPVDLLLTDLVMPGGMSGFDLAVRLQAERPGLRVIFTSGYGAKAGPGPVLIEGENFLQKPFAPQKLAQTVRSCLDRKAGPS